jgi:hypothetical protein
LGRTFLFPVDISSCPALSAILSQLFSPLNPRQNCGRLDIPTALETEDNRWATNEAFMRDIITKLRQECVYIITKLRQESVYTITKLRQECVYIS